MKKQVIILISVLFVSISVSGQFPRDRKIDAAEYFIDTDPGEGNGTAISVGSTPLWEVTVNIQNLAVQAGSDVYVRFRSTNGSWSAPRAIRRMEYFPNQGAHIEYGEYFINEDPGEGNGTEVVFSSGGLLNLNGLDLQKGDLVFLRIRDSYNRWSNARPVKFNYKEIDFAEYTVKHESGDSTSQFLMSVSQSNPSTCVYTSNADTDTNSVVKDDVVYVRMRTSERFYSQWAHSAPYIPPPPNLIAEPDEIRQIQATPNPFRDRFKLSIDSERSLLAAIRIIDFNGKCCIKIPEILLMKGGNTVNIDGQELANGIYSVILTADNKILSNIRVAKIE